jgi:hypothetical protein
MAETIRFRPIPPRSPHLNGKVERTTLEEFWATVNLRASDIADQLANGCITITGIGHTSLCTAYRRSIACASAPRRRPYTGRSAMPMSLLKSAFRFAITPLA